jgi:hypothetical protein
MITIGMTVGTETVGAETIGTETGATSIAFSEAR